MVLIMPNGSKNRFSFLTPCPSNLPVFNMMPICSQDVKLQRRAYMAAEAQAKSDPGSILVMAIDGAGLQRFAYPFFRQLTKEAAKGWRIRTKLIGALVTGWMMQFYTVASNWETGNGVYIAGSLLCVR